MMHKQAFVTIILFLASVGSYAWENRVKRNINRSFLSELTVHNGGLWGTWGQKEMCPSGFYAAGFTLRVEYPISGDDSALNGVLLHCVNTYSGTSGPYEDYATIQSDVGSWGEFTKLQWCKSGMLASFQLAVEPPQGWGDDTSANNIKFKCSGDGEELVGNGASWGEWGSWSNSCEGKGICGIQTKVEVPQGMGDDTALNDVRFFCCD